jgi:hypothetical protein
LRRSGREIGVTIRELRASDAQRATLLLRVTLAARAWLTAMHPRSALLPLAILIFSVVAPCQRDASPVSVRRQTSTTGC